MAAEPFTWSQGNQLVNELGEERWLAQRIQDERKARGWSQAELSRQLREINHPLHQSAISKIEPADPDQKAGRRRSTTSGERRSVTIDEAVGFSKVFGIPLGELLLPPDAVATASAARAYSEGPDALRSLLSAQRRYERLVSRVADHAARDKSFLLWLSDHFEAVREKQRAAGLDEGDSFNGRFTRDALMRATETIQKAEGEKR